MQSLRIPFFALLGILLNIAPLGAESLRDQMSESQFEKAGLEKLSPEELAYLSDWFGGKVDEEKERVVAQIIPEGEDRFGADEKIRKNVERIRPEQKALTSRILGPFKGWRGNTVFNLENGQVWRQSEGGRFVVNLKDPEILIEKGMFGTYFLKVEGYGSRVKVKRQK